MGWASAYAIFDPVAQALIDADADYDLIVEVLSKLIATLLEGDWDTYDESLEKFKGEPAVRAAFDRNGITPAPEPESMQRKTAAWTHVETLATPEYLSKLLEQVKNGTHVTILDDNYHPIAVLVPNNDYHPQ